jgi:hypothetical protein
MTARARRSKRSTVGVGTHVTGSSRRPFSNHTAHLVQGDSWFQFGHPPGGASLGIGCEVGPGGTPYERHELDGRD